MTTWESPRIWGYHSEGFHNKDQSILRSILGAPYFWKLPTLNSKPLHICIRTTLNPKPMHTYYIRVLLYSYYTTITGGVLLIYIYMYIFMERGLESVGLSVRDILILQP